MVNTKKFNECRSVSCDVYKLISLFLGTILLGTTLFARAVDHNDPNKAVDVILAGRQ
jgi:hypothetical protein